MNFTESNTVEEMILDAATSLGSGAGSSVLREDPPSGWGGSLGEEFKPSRWTYMAATALPRQPGEVMVEPWVREALIGPERVRAVVEHIVQHYQTRVEPNGFKAQVVCFNRECCVLYKAVMDEIAGPEASAIVMSGAQKDPPAWSVHMRDKDAEEKLLDRFRDPADPLRFVIVTSKLLTGFDAPILQAMYGFAE